MNHASRGVPSLDKFKFYAKLLVCFNSKNNLEWLYKTVGALVIVYRGHLRY